MNLRKAIDISNQMVNMIINKTRGIVNIRTKNLICVTGTCWKYDT